MLLYYSKVLEDRSSELRKLKLAFLLAGRSPSIYLALNYNTYRYYRQTGISTSE
jgi:hypothetical protein